MVSRAELERRSWVKVRNWHFSFFPGPVSHAPLQADWALGTGRAIGAHTGAVEQCAAAIEEGVCSDGPARVLHTCTGSRSLGRAIGGDEAAYVMPDWAGKWLV